MNNRLESEQTVNQSKTISHDILDSFIEGCQVISPDWRYLYVNDATAIQARCSRDKLLGHTMIEAFPGIELTPMFAMLRSCMENRSHRRMENEFRYPDGSTGWFDLRFEPVSEGILILSIDISDVKRAQQEQAITLEVLQLINNAKNKSELLGSVLGRLKEWSGCEAVGIRLREDSDFPYYQTSGFPREFVRMENHLCGYDKDGNVICDEDGDPILECMCGNIIRGRFDPSKNFFTADGSFWSNCTTDLLATTTNADRQARTRNRCNGEGYESVALIPLRCDSETFGLIQFNDTRKGRFTPESIALFRRIADHIANFLAKKQAENRVSRLNSMLRGIMNVNQLITRERDRTRLIQKVCNVLVESQGFRSASIKLFCPAEDGVSTYAGAGEEPASLRSMLAHGEWPVCARMIINGDQDIVYRNCHWTCGKCPAAREISANLATFVIGLKQGNNSYGIMMACLPNGVSGHAEEQALLSEMASDIAFALHDIDMEHERDQSTAALVDIQEQLRQTQKLEAIGQLAGGVAHDFNNILMAQLGYCEFVKDGLGEESPLRTDLEEIEACAQRAAELTRQLLAFSRKQTLQPVVLNLNAVITNLEKMLRRLIGEDIQFIMLLENGIDMVMVDPSQIEQVIMNIVLNARDAMPQGGTLTIETANIDPCDNSTLNNHEEVREPQVMLSITDTGCGMGKSTIERVFEPFFTTKEKGKGTGLGMATVYGIIKQSGGDISVHSNLGKGTTFRISLPSAENADTRQVARKTGAILGSGELILVVEDEPMLRRLLTRMIMHLGYRVKSASEGSEALHLIEAQHVRPDLLITDVVMPGMNGTALVKRLHSILPDLKILYTSGYTDNTIVDHGVIDVETPFIQKPFTSENIAEKIHEVLSGKHL